MRPDAEDRVRPMTPDDLALVRSWRNHPSIRHNMYSQHEVSEDEHHGWFERASQLIGRHLLIFEAEFQPRGFVQVTSKGADPVAEWGFYTSPDAPRGTGRRMGQAALEFIFGSLRIHKVCGQALAYNKKSIRFHLSLGFQQEGILREQHFDGVAFHDVYCFGMLARDWHTTT
jgi:UDP-4-amino-4,6-dideoxy-N-acetyl-beta-L-altrosamine N-acetyltransferase